MASSLVVPTLGWDPAQAEAMSHLFGCLAPQPLTWTRARMDADGIRVPLDSAQVAHLSAWIDSFDMPMLLRSELKAWQGVLPRL